MNLEKVIQKIESEDAATGIGAAAATAGVLAASLVIKIANKSGLEDIKRESEKVKQELTKLIKEDAKAYKSYMKAYKSKDEEKIEKALKYAIETPMRIAEQSYKVIELAGIVLEKGKKSMALEAYGAATIGRAATEAAVEVVELNLNGLKDEIYSKEMKLRKYELRLNAKIKEAKLYAAIGEYIYSK